MLMASSKARSQGPVEGTSVSEGLVGWILLMGRLLLVSVCPFFKENDAIIVMVFFYPVVCVVEPTEPKYFIVPKYERPLRRRSEQNEPCEEHNITDCDLCAVTVNALSPQTSPVGSPQRFTYDFVPLPLAPQVRSNSPPHVVKCMVDGIPQDDAEPLASKRHPLVTGLMSKSTHRKAASKPTDDNFDAHSDGGW
jgi:hypothetical protein